MAGQDRPVVETLWSVASQQDNPLLVAPPPRQVAAEMKIKNNIKSLEIRKAPGNYQGKCKPVGNVCPGREGQVLLIMDYTGRLSP